MQPGDVLGGRFELERIAGKGGMGEVFRARDRSSGDAVAVKVLHHEQSGAGRFLREAQLLAELSHPGIVRYLGHGIARDRILAIAAGIDDPSRQKSFLENVPENARTLSLAQAWLGEPAVVLS